MLTAAEIERFLQDDGAREAVAKLPANIGGRAEDLAAEYASLKETVKKFGGGIFGIGRKMPQEQVRVHRQRLLLLEKIFRAIQLGYEPYHPPSNWYVGWFTWREERLVWSNIRLFSHSPVPPRAILKYARAKKTGLFSAFLVAAPDRSLFNETRIIFSDPVLIGFVRGSQAIDLEARVDGGVQKPGLTVTHGAGFLVDMWNLEKDRRTAGMDF